MIKIKIYFGRMQMRCRMWEEKVRATIQRAEEKNKNSDLLCSQDSPSPKRLIVLLGWQFFVEPSEWTIRPFEVSHCSDLLLMDSAFQADGALKIRHLTNNNMSDLLGESLLTLTVSASLMGKLHNLTKSWF